MLMFFRHQVGWFPFRPEQQNLRGGERPGAPQEEAEQHQDIQEMVSQRMSLCCFPFMSLLQPLKLTIFADMV